MKKILLGTTALVGATLFAHQAMAEVTVTLGGNVEFQAGFYDQDDDADVGTNSRDFQVESEIVVRANGKADNGLLYGAKVELLASQSDTEASDEVMMYVSGTWGRVELGDEDGAADTMIVFAPTVGIGQVDGAYTDFIFGNPGVSVKPLDSGDDTKITYYTPRFAGFQVGASYAPELGSDGENVVTSENWTAGNTHENMVELGANYQGSFAGFSVVVAGTYTFAEAKDNKPVNVAGDFDGWGAGLQVGWGGFTVGGNYFQNDFDDSGTANFVEDGFTVGVTYETGAFGVGASYLNNDFDNGGDIQGYGVGATYTVAPGLTTNADLMFVDTENAGGNERDGWVAIIGTNVTF